jgi:hypothetical protein
MIMAAPPRSDTLAGSVPPLRTKRSPVWRRVSPAERLVYLEREDERISRALHRLTRLREQYKGEALRLRVSFTSEDRALYDALRSMR